MPRTFSVLSSTLSRAGVAADRAVATVPVTTLGVRTPTPPTRRSRLAIRLPVSDCVSPLDETERTVCRAMSSSLKVIDCA